VTAPFGDLRALVRFLAARVAEHPDYADLRDRYGLALACAGDAAAAATQFEAALRMNPSFEAARFNLAWLRVRSPEVGASRHDSPFPVALATQLELVRIASADPRRALATLEAATSVASELDRVWILVQAGDTATAQDAFARVVARDADFATLAATVGLEHESRVDVTALAAWSDTYGGNPNVSALAPVAAALARATADDDAALRFLAWGCLLSGDLAAYWVARAEHSTLRGDDAAAAAALRRAVEIDPNRVAARVALGFMHASNGSLEAAVAEFETAARLAPHYADVRYELALAYADSERAQDAERELRAALSIQPEYVLAKLALGSLLANRGSDDEALRLLQQVRSGGLRSVDLETQLAALHARLGHKIQARRALGRARARGRVTPQSGQRR
jgi:tetratricopeptide (TPR) repeat protein